RASQASDHIQEGKFLSIGVIHGDRLGDAFGPSAHPLPGSTSLSLLMSGRAPAPGVASGSVSSGRAWGPAGCMTVLDRRLFRRASFSSDSRAGFLRGM